MISVRKVALLSMVIIINCSITSSVKALPIIHDTKQLLIVGAATTVSALIGKYTYDYFFKKLSDTQELLKAEELCLKTTSYAHEIQEAYHEEFTLLEKLTDNVEFSNFIKTKIGSLAYERPFLTYVQQLNLASKHLTSYNKQLLKRRNHLMKRVEQLGHNSTLSDDKQKQYYREYTTTLDQIYILSNKIQPIIETLYTIKKHSVSFNEYTQESILARLETIESKLWLLEYNRVIHYNIPLIQH